VLQADFILCDDQIYLLEINPRWTAGMEIAEMIAPGKIATQFTSQAGDRPSAFLNTSAETHFDSNAFVVKQIIYAKQSFVVSQEYSDCLLGQIGWNRIDEILTSDRPDDSGECLPLHYRLADIPESDSSLERGTPVCTLLVRGEFKDATSLDLGSRESFQWLEKLADRLHPLEQIWKPETRVPKN
jgi:predicted ATP-grasp superfamily ATP-dependent carboligase